MGFRRAGDAPQFGHMGSLASENSLSCIHTSAFLNVHELQ